MNNNLYWDYKLPLVHQSHRHCIYKIIDFLKIYKQKGLTGQMFYMQGCRLTSFTELDAYMQGKKVGLDHMAIFNLN